MIISKKIIITIFILLFIHVQSMEKNSGNNNIRKNEDDFHPCNLKNYLKNCYNSIKNKFTYDPRDYAQELIDLENAEGPRTYESDEKIISAIKNNKYAYQAMKGLAWNAEYDLGHTWRPSGETTAKDIAVMLINNMKNLKTALHGFLLHNDQYTPRDVLNAIFKHQTNCEIITAISDKWIEAGYEVNLNDFIINNMNKSADQINAGHFTTVEQKFHQNSNTIVQIKYDQIAEDNIRFAMNQFSFPYGSIQNFKDFINSVQPHILKIHKQTSDTEFTILNKIKTGINFTEQQKESLNHQRLIRYLTFLKDEEKKNITKDPRDIEPEIFTKVETDVKQKINIKKLN